MKTLLLSIDWIVDRVIDWEEAMCLVCSGRAEVIEPYEDKFIRSGQSVFSMPCVIRYTTGNPSARAKIKRRNVTKSALYERDEKCCQYCGIYLKKGEATIDHIFPKSRGGKNSWSNFVLSCKKCNNKKSNKTPEEAGMPILRPETIKAPISGYYTIKQLEIHAGGHMQDNWKLYVVED